MTTGIIIGIDIGTSGTKAIAVTTQGEVTGHAYVSYNPLKGLAGYHELSPDELLGAVLTCIGRVVKEAMADSASLLGISFSAAMHSVIVVDKNGQPLTNAITWADARSAAYAQALKGTPQGAGIYRHTGTPIHPMSPLCKIMWIRNHQPEVFMQAGKFISIKEYIFYRLFDRYLIDHSIASCTGLFDIYEKTWYAPALQTAGITEHQLSEPIPTTTVVKGLKKEYALQLGIDAGTPFIIGASDGCLANLGSHATEPGDMAITIGTSGAVRMITTQPRHDEKERTFNYILTSDRYVSGGPVNNGVVVLKWYAEQFLKRPFAGVKDMEWFLQQAAEAPPGCDGLIFLPYVMGERAPVWDAGAKGVFAGMHTGHTQSHGMRAIVEGINYALFQVAASVRETMGPWQRIYASGGFINSPVWLQWLTNLFGHEITVINKEDASSLGAVLLGLQALGIFLHDDSTPFFEVKRRFLPDTATHALYMKYFEVYAGLYPALQQAFNHLNIIANSTSKS